MTDFEDNIRLYWIYSKSSVLQRLEASFKLRSFGRNLTPRDEVGPQGWSYPQWWRPSVCRFILLNIRKCSPSGVNEGVNNTPRGQSSNLWAKFTPRADLRPGANYVVKNWPQSSFKVFPFHYMHMYTHTLSHVAPFYWGRHNFGWFFTHFAQNSIWIDYFNIVVNRFWQNHNIYVGIPTWGLIGKFAQL
jgi:hypothetical protein